MACHVSSSSSRSVCSASQSEASLALTKLTSKLSSAFTCVQLDLGFHHYNLQQTSPEALASRRPKGWLSTELLTTQCGGVTVRALPTGDAADSPQSDRPAVDEELLLAYEGQGSGVSGEHLMSAACGRCLLPSMCFVLTVMSSAYCWQQAAGEARLQHDGHETVRHIRAWHATARIQIVAAGSTQPPQEAMGGSSRSALDKSRQGGSGDKDLLNAHW